MVASRTFSCPTVEYGQVRVRDDAQLVVETFVVDLVFGLAFLIGSIGTYARFLNRPSAALRQAEDVRLICLSTRDLTFP